MQTSFFCCVCKYNYRLSWGCQEPPQASTGTYDPWKQARNAMSWGWIGRILSHLSFTSWLHSWETSGKRASLSNSVLLRLGCKMITVLNCKWFFSPPAEKLYSNSAAHVEQMLLLVHPVSYFSELISEFVPKSTVKNIPNLSPLRLTFLIDICLPEEKREGVKKSKVWNLTYTWKQIHAVLVTHTHIYTHGWEHLLIRSRNDSRRHNIGGHLGFDILLKDTSVCRPLTELWTTSATWATADPIKEDLSGF